MDGGTKPKVANAGRQDKEDTYKKQDTEYRDKRTMQDSITQLERKSASQPPSLLLSSLELVDTQSL